MNDLFRLLNSRIVKVVLAAVAVTIFTWFSRCNKDKGLNVYGIDQDVKLGQQLALQISNDPAQYPILDEQKYPKAYEHLRRITGVILNSGKVKYRDKFDWKLNIIHDDNTLNAFCAPGGYICVYTGLIKYLDHESELAGVLGHEIAHADLRHSTEAMTRQMGAEAISALILGNDRDQLSNVVNQLTGLKYSRDNEAEADAASIEYLCNTPYDARGTAGFFAKMLKENKGGKQPEFLSTHPSPASRVQDIHDLWKQKGCTPKEDKEFDALYQDFKRSLP